MSLKEEVFAYLERPNNLSLSESTARRERFTALPDELWEMAEQMSPAGATLAVRAENARKIMTEAMKLAEAWPGDGVAARIAAAVKPAGSAESGPILTFADARPDVQLAKLADEIRLAEDVGYGEALSLAKQRDPELAKRYADDNYGGTAPAASTDRPDVELAERAKARAEKDGIDYGKAMSLELADDPALASRYYERNLSGAGSKPAVKVKPPRGMRLCEARADVELAERSEALAAAEGIDYGAAMNRVLAENPKLKSRYHDYSCGESALDELAYRAKMILGANAVRLSEQKAADAALAEDPTLREAVFAYFEPAPYTIRT